MRTEPTEREPDRPHIGRFLTDPDVVACRVGPARADGGALFVWRDAIDALLAAARIAPGPFYAALLLGVAGQTPAGFVTEIRAWADLDQADDEASWTQELLRQWDVSSNRIARAYPGMVRCGWVALRRGNPPTMTPDAAVAHRTFFGLPWQVTMLLDPETETLAFWGAAPSGDLVNIGFTVLSRRGREGVEHADH